MVHQVIGAIATGIGLLTEPGLCFEGLQNGFEKKWKQFCDLPSRNWFFNMLLDANSSRHVSQPVHWPQDKYMLGATNFVEHYAHDFHATHAQKDFVKAAMYGGAILGMIVMGSLAAVWKDASGVTKQT